MADRPIFTPVFEEGESAILDRVVARVSDRWRAEPGDFMHDAVATTPLEVKQLQINQDYILKSRFAQYAEEGDLDLCLADIGLRRFDATANKRQLTVVGDPGVRIPKTYTLTTVVLDSSGVPLEYTTDAEIVFGVATTTQTVTLTCKTAGAVGNIATGSQFILQPPIPGVSSITDNGTTVPGTERESDAAAWERYKLKAQNPDTGGNKNDYVRWVQDNVAGVGKAISIPRWNGNGTVKVVIVDSDYKPASGAIVSAAQAYLDPIGYQGLGYGKAPCGAVVTAVSAAGKAINIAATVSYSQGADPTAVKAAFEAAVTAYLKALVFSIDQQTGDLYPVAYNKIGALLISTPGVENYSGLTVNNGTADVALVLYEVATLGTVTI